jgi:phosphoesterase RecJ-like protein
MPSHDLLAVPESRAFPLRRVLQRLLAARRVVLVTHVGADGDGSGSQAAVAAWLESRGIEVAIVNPTPFPDLFRFCLHRQDVVAEMGTPEGEAALADADLFVVLDTSEPPRVGALASASRRSARWWWTTTPPAARWWATPPCRTPRRAPPARWCTT